MKNTQKGFIVPLLIAIAAVLIIGGGVYYYSQKKSDVSQDNKTSDNAQASKDTVGGQGNDNQTVNVTQPKAQPVITVTNQYEGWQTYKDASVYNTFTIQFPGDWVRGKSMPGIYTKTYSAGKYCGVDVQGLNTTKDGTSFQSEIGDLIQKGYTQSSTSVAGVNATVLHQSHPGITTAIYFTKNNYDYRISLDDSSGGNPDCVSSFNKIASSFKFTK